MKHATNDSAVSAPEARGSTDQWEGHMYDGIGATYGPEPMASLGASPQELSLIGSRGTFHLPRASVIKIGRGGFYPWCFGGVRIHHANQAYPKELVFKPLGVKEGVIIHRLRSLGFGGSPPS